LSKKFPFLIIEGRVKKDLNDLKLYLKIKKRQRQERKKVMGFIRRIKRAQKHKEKVRKNCSLALPIP